MVRAIHVCAPMRATLGIFVVLTGCTAEIGDRAGDGLAPISDDGTLELGGSADALDCAAPANLPTEPVLLVTRANSQLGSILDDLFPLSKVLDQIARTGASNESGTTLYRRLWDSLNSRSNGTFSESFAPHCDDNGQTINGFPITCNRREGSLAVTVDPNALFKPVAVVNRFDLMRATPATCGEYRIVYALREAFQGRAFVIFEAALPNPDPDGDASGCEIYGQLWTVLEGQNRATVSFLLERLFFQGVQGLPAVHADNYGLAGRGQVRTNLFMDTTWQLREFQVARSTSGSLYFAPSDVEHTPDRSLLSATAPSGGSLPDVFQRLYPDASLGSLLGPVAEIGAGLPDFSFINAGESMADFRLFATLASPRFAGEIQGSINRFRNAHPGVLPEMAGAFTPAHYLNRLETQTCAGCHFHSSNAELDASTRFPVRSDFVHINERGEISAALAEVFLPHRARVLGEFLCERSGALGAARAGLTTASAELSAGRRATLGGSLTH